MSETRMLLNRYTSNAVVFLVLELVLENPLGLRVELLIDKEP
jgi:hypothetical protein